MKKEFPQTQKESTHILLTVALAAVVLVLGAFFLNTQKGPIPNLFPQQLSSTDCQEPIFSKIPVDPAKILSVTPLGHLNPPDHTTPTDHIYLVVKENNELHPEFATEVVAPANITIQTITKQTITQNGHVQNQDYAIDFSPCKKVQAKFGHVTNVSPKLTQATEGKGSCQTNHPRPGDDYSYCRYDLNLKVSKGELLGEAGGGKATGLDFWAIDYRSADLKMANPARYGKPELHTACPVDLFDKNSKEVLAAKFGRYNQRRTIEPLCGEFNQDKLGTTQGNWTTAHGYIDRPEAWSKSLALVHDNVDPRMGELSIGGTITNSQRIQFTPQREGRVNREFSDIKNDGEIYCFEGESISQIRGGQGGRVLIQLMSDTSLKAEHQPGSCAESVRFTSPTIYQR